jgi:oligoribonuclease NrnB/cAMP/cGMP phosphodiesterase (DHH superfamily)
MKPRLKPVLIYHGGCPDGFGAAYAFWKKYGDDIDYIPLSHKEAPFKGLDESVLRDREVWMVDIAFEREDAIRIKEIANKFQIIDHHVSAQKKLDDLEFCHFDMYHSGAVLGWNHCFPNEEAPKLLRYIEDRDLWNWNLPYAQELLTAVDSYEKTFEIWDEINRKVEDPIEFSKLLAEGSAILRYNEVLMSRVKKGTYYAKIKGYRVPILNTPFFRSEILAELCSGEFFSAGYHYDGENFIFSLRADGNNPDSIDVSEIAGMFPGGGGHRNASGFAIKSLADLSG